MPRIYASFERLENAKAAVGRIKKASWNRAEIVVLASSEPGVDPGAARYEFADEHFLDSPVTRRETQWPVLKEQEIEGLGKVFLAASFRPDDVNRYNHWPAVNPELTAADLKKNRVVAIMEVAAELSGKIKTILQSEGAEITFFAEKREEL
ncbi:MAG: hypothetical protein GX075_09960 [Firmicutes bacterium]|nr:hypothetical protein [Bacillota bacterium]